MIPPSSTTRQKHAKTIIRKLRKLFPNAHCTLRYKTHWHLMVAVQLSAQCTDKKVNEVTQKLFKKYKTLDDYVRAKPHAFERDIYQTGFYRNKTKNILAAAKIVKEKYKGKIPNTMEEILTLPGVARKTANVVLGNAYGIVEGIAVDTHVKRLTKKFGLTKETDPVKIEHDLMEIIPKKDWLLFTYLIIEFGRMYCPARAHDHTEHSLREMSSPQAKPIDVKLKEIDLTSVPVPFHRRPTRPAR